jgi:hypothetical protein
MKHMNEITEVDETQLSEDLPDDLLPGKQEQALAALLSHRTIKEAAIAAGISEATMWRYRRDPAFRKRLCQARRELTSDLFLRLQHDAVAAANVLRDIAHDMSASAPARVTASRSIISLAIKGVEVLDHDESIEELEENCVRMAEERALDQAEGELR